MKQISFILTLLILTTSSVAAAAECTVVGANNPATPVQITELFPNPVAPQVDEKDEFIEVFNPNDQQYDLSGYILETGVTAKHRYTLPAGTVVAPGAYATFTSAVTRASLANGGSQARVLDPSGAMLVQTDAYGDAKDGQAWILSGGIWQWTVTPTPGAPNALQVPPVPEPKPPVVSAAPPKASVKSAKTTTPKVAKVTKPKTKAAASTAGATETVATVAPPPKSTLHTGVLAAFAVFALLYGAYEYRRDLANYFHRRRTNRAARRASGPEPEGRGGD